MEYVSNLVPELFISITALDEGERSVSPSGSLNPGGKKWHLLNGFQGPKTLPRSRMGPPLFSCPAGGQVTVQAELPQHTLLDNLNSANTF